MLLLSVRVVVWMETASVDSKLCISGKDLLVVNSRFVFLVLRTWQFGILPVGTNLHCLVWIARPVYGTVVAEAKALAAGE